MNHSLEGKKKKKDEHTQFNTQLKAGEVLLLLLLLIYLYGSLVAVCGSCQSVPADDHHPSHRSPMGARLAVDSVGQHVRL